VCTFMLGLYCRGTRSARERGVAGRASSSSIITNSIGSAVCRLATSTTVCSGRQRPEETWRRRQWRWRWWTGRDCVNYTKRNMSAILNHVTMIIVNTVLIAFLVT